MKGMRFLLSFVFHLTLVFSTVSWAATPKQESLFPRTLAIQKRPYILNHEISIHVSYLPLDYFTTYLSAGFAFTQYFTDYFGWELVNANSAQSSSTGLESYVRNQGAIPEGLDVMNYYATSNLVYTPLYMKNLFMKDHIVWGDVSFVGGYGQSHFKVAGNVGTVDFGVLLRFFSGAKFATKFDLRQYTYLAGGLKPNLAVTLGFSYNFGSDATLANATAEE
jgi:outer membrane beta-barrel protein